MAAPGESSSWQDWGLLGEVILAKTHLSSTTQDARGLLGGIVQCLGGHVVAVGHHLHLPLLHHTGCKGLAGGLGGLAGGLLGIAKDC